MSEKTAPIGIKALTVVVAIGLASGYIFVRSNKPSPPQKRPVVGEKQNPGIEKDLEGGPNPGESSPSDPVIMSSSKSISPAIEMTEELRQTLMSSSKSGIIVPPVTIEKPAEEKKPEKPRTILPGSKSMPMKFIEEREPDR